MTSPLNTYNGTPIETASEAFSKGLRSMTHEYILPGEQWMLDNVINDLRNGRIRFSLVAIRGGIEVWRGPLAPSS